MLITLTTKSEHLIICIKKDILMENSREFSEELEKTLQQAPDCQKISFDFEAVKFMDSSGIGFLIKASSKAKNENKDIIVYNLNKTLHSVFKLSGLHNMISIYSRTELLAKFPELDNV
ncbi:MAG: STAS domain-containing protein [Spirochaetota bacterium]